MPPALVFAVLLLGVSPLAPGSSLHTAPSTGRNEIPRLASLRQGTQVGLTSDSRRDDPTDRRGFSIVGSTSPNSGSSTDAKSYGNIFPNGYRTRTNDRQTELALLEMTLVQALAREGGNFTMCEDGARVTITEPGIVTSANYPAMYEANQQCRYKIRAPRRHLAVLVLVDVQVPCVFGDRLRLNVPGTRQGRSICSDVEGSYLQHMVYQSTTRELMLTFQTDDLQESTGFIAVVFFSEEPRCADQSDVYSEPEGVIQYPSIFDGDYQNYQLRQWQVRAPTMDWVSFSVLEMDVETDESCSYDGLIIESIYSFEMLCSRYSDEYHLVVPYHIAKLTFYSDSSITGRGFTLVYEFAEGVLAACGFYQPEYIESHRGHITFLNSPSYDNDMSCTWDVQGRRRRALELTFLVFDLQGSLPDCQHDGLIITKDHSHQVATLCGHQLPEPMLIDADNVQFTFYSDRNATYVGFKIRFRSVGRIILDVTVPARVLPGECGQPVISPGLARVVGGTEAIPHSWPWMVSLRGLWNHALFCGGSLIASQWVLTTAHCVTGVSPGEFYVLLGDHNQAYPETPSEYGIMVIDIISHQNYNDATLDSDIALLNLQFPVPFTDFVSPVCLAQTDPSPGHTCVITGWGDTEYTADPTLLQQAPVPLISRQDCTQSGWYEPSDITQNMLCAGYGEGGVDTCYGDSGGPLVCPVDDTFYLMGITSWGNGCADPRSPGVYTRVSRFYDWIMQNIA